MAQKSKDMGRAPNGNGCIRKKTVTKNGRTYEYWEGRCSVGYDPITGQQKQRSISGSTKKEVLEKMRTMAYEVDSKNYYEPCAMPLSDWLNTWLDEYLFSVKESTLYHYRRSCELHIIPSLGKVRLDALNPAIIQKMYNSLQKPPHSLAAKTIKDTHGVLHQAMQQAVDNGYIKTNPTNACKLPRVQKKEIEPIEEAKLSEFLRAISGHPHEYIYIITLFTGLREGEILGLTWDCIDFDRGLMTVKQQLRRQQIKGGKYYISTPKNRKKRIIALPDTVLNTFRLQKQKIEQMKANAAEAWTSRPMIFSDTADKELPFDLVFRNESGGLLSYRTVYDCFKRIVAKIGIPDARFHDLRHTYAVAAIQSGDDIKTIQENLGHATATFTLDIYGHVTEKMKRRSAERMESFIRSVAV